MEFYTAAHLKLRESIHQQGLDGVLVTDLANVRRLCGFTGSNGALLFTKDDAIFLTDSRYKTQALSETSDVEVREGGGKKLPYGALVKDLGLKRVGYEGDDLRCSAYRALKEEASGVEFSDLGPAISRIRECKTPNEIGKMRAASLLAEEALSEVKNLFVAGVTEFEVAKAFQVAVINRGARLAFDVIVAGGP
ncbi:MAG: hypothetical protein C0609_05150, partial [Deltaproteobacteria bacterium]